MKRIELLAILLILNCLAFGQSIVEICESAPPNGTMVDCQYFQDTLYATGFFDQICGEAVGYIAKWDSNEWKPAAFQLSDPGHSLTVLNDKLYIGRYEESIDSNWVYVYDGSTLEKVGKGVYLTTASNLSRLPNIYDITEYDGKLIACGEFDRVGDEAIQGIMQWEGDRWAGMGSGLSGSIPQTGPVMFPHQMIVHEGELYVIGNFRNAGGVEVNGIAKWDGTSWTNLGAGFNSTVYSITVFKGEIIVGGGFTESNGTPLNRIAKWNGTDWEALDFGFIPSSSNDFIFVHTLKVIDSVLYMGGGLKQILYADSSTEVCNGIVALSGDTLNTFMGGVPNNDIEAMCKIEEGKLMLGGGVFNSGYTGVVEIPLTTHIASPQLSKIHLFPNPFETILTIETQARIERYEVLNAVGERVRSGKFQPSLELNAPAGLYFLKLIQRDNSYSIHKILKR